MWLAVMDPCLCGVLLSDEASNSATTTAGSHRLTPHSLPHPSSHRTPIPCPLLSCVVCVQVTSAVRAEDVGLLEQYGMCVGSDPGMKQLLPYFSSFVATQVGYPGTH